VDVLVLGGGGILGEAWMSSLLAGLEQGEAFDARGCRCYVGTSAGSIVAASLVAGVAPDAGLGRAAEDPVAPALDFDETGTPLRQAFDAVAALGGVAAAPLASLALSSTVTGGAIIRRAALRRVRPGDRSLDELGRMIEGTGARWDGRLRIAAVELESGRRVIFGAPGAPQLPVSAAVQASCAIPGVFRPVKAGGHTYVDGGVWSPTNMDAAEVRRGDRVLCLNPTGSLRGSNAPLVRAIGNFSRGAATAEGLVLKHRGASVRIVNPDAAATVAMGRNLMNPRRRGVVIKAGLAQGRRLADGSGLRAA
jgi:NTE family protein